METIQSAHSVLLSNGFFLLKFGRTPALTVLLGGLICCLVIYLYMKRFSKLPPGPIGLPVLGYIPFLGKRPYVTLDELSKKYGNFYSISMGRHLAVVINSYEVARDTLNTAAFLGRPSVSSFNYIPDSLGMAVTNGLVWQDHRKFTSRVLKKLLETNRFEELIKEEIEKLVKILESNGKHSYLEKIIFNCMASSVWCVSFGENITDSKKTEILHKGTYTISKAFEQITSTIYLHPWLQAVYNYFKVDKSLEKNVKDLSDLNRLIGNEVEARKKTFLDKSRDNHHYNYVSKFLEVHQGVVKQSTDTYTVPMLKGTLQGFFFGGGETLTASMKWTLYALIGYPEVQSRIQSEIDSVTGRERRIRWMDHLDMPYTQAVLSEIARWRTLSPIPGLRITLEDCNVLGFYVPQGTLVLTNMWKMHNDPKYWDAPEEFRPERFLSEDGSKYIKRESFLPFMLGKRKCLGEDVAVRTLFLCVTTILQKFTLRMPEGVAVDLDSYLDEFTFSPVDQPVCFVRRN